MPLRRAGAGEGPSQGRRVCSQTQPSPGGPLAGEHNPDRSYLYTSLIAHPKSPRELVESAETCVKSHLRWSSTVSRANAVALEPRKQRSKRALGRVADPRIWLSYSLTDLTPRSWAFSFIFSTSRPCKWTRVLIVIFLGFRIGPAPSMASCFAAKRGMYGQGWI